MLSRLGKRGYTVEDEPRGAESDLIPIAIAISIPMNQIPN